MLRLEKSRARAVRARARGWPSSSFFFPPSFFRAEFALGSPAPRRTAAPIVYPLSFPDAIHSTLRDIVTLFAARAEHGLHIRNRLSAIF